MLLTLLLMTFFFSDSDLIIITNKQSIKNNFYGAIKISHYGTSTIVLDRGNSKLYMYDAFNHLSLSFGENGNGPGEFSKGIHSIKLSKNFIYTFTNRKIQVFDKRGTYLHDIPFRTAQQDKICVQNDNIIINRVAYQHRKIIAFTISANGLITERIENPLYKEKKDRIEIKQSSDEAQFFLEHNKYFIISMNGSYKINCFDKIFNHVKSLVQPFDRIKADVSSYGLKYVPKSQRAEALKYFENYSGGFKNDLKGIFTVKKHLVVLTETKVNNHIQLDIYDDNLKFIGTQKIEFPNSIEAVAIENEKLLMHLKNNEDGSFVETYDININEKEVARN